MAINLREIKDRSDGGRAMEQISFYLILPFIFGALLAASFLKLLPPWTWKRRFQSKDERWFVARAWDDATTLLALAYQA
jgi:hypothetical protein